MLHRSRLLVVTLPHPMRFRIPHLDLTQILLGQAAPLDGHCDRREGRDTGGCPGRCRQGLDDPTVDAFQVNHDDSPIRWKNPGLAPRGPTGYLDGALTQALP